MKALLPAVAAIFVVAAVAGFLTDTPKYQLTAATQTELKLVVRHSGKLLGECRIVSQEELAGVPANMRKPLECPREKAPLKVNFHIDNQMYFEETVLPSGIHDDGVLAMFRKLPVEAGRHEFRLQVSHQMDGEEQVEELVRAMVVRPEKIIIAEYTDAGFRLYQPGT